MIPLKPDTSFAVHLRASSSSGGKDWVGSVTVQCELHIYWGKTGQIVQHAAKPGDFDALNKIIMQKIQGKDKYQMVDEYTSQRGWKSQRAQMASPAQTRTQPVIHKDITTSVVDWNHDETPVASIIWDF